MFTDIENPSLDQANTGFGAPEALQISRPVSFGLAAALDITDEVSISGLSGM